METFFPEVSASFCLLFTAEFVFVLDGQGVTPKRGHIVGDRTAFNKLHSHKRIRPAFGVLEILVKRCC